MSYSSRKSLMLSHWFNRLTSLLLIWLSGLLLGELVSITRPMLLVYPVNWSLLLVKVANWAWLKSLPLVIQTDVKHKHSQTAAQALLHLYDRLHRSVRSYIPHVPSLLLSWFLLIFLCYLPCPALTASGGLLHIRLIRKQAESCRSLVTEEDGITV